MRFHVSAFLFLALMISGWAVPSEAAPEGKLAPTPESKPQAIDRMRLSKNYVFELFDEGGKCRIQLKIPTGFAADLRKSDIQSKKLTHKFNFSTPCFIDQLFLLRAKGQHSDSLPWQAITVYSLKPIGETKPKIKKVNGQSCYKARYARGLAFFRVNHISDPTYQPYFVGWLDETDDEGHWMCINLKQMQVLEGGFQYDEMISHINSLQEAVKMQLPEKIRDNY